MVFHLFKTFPGGSIQSGGKLVVLQPEAGIGSIQFAGFRHRQPCFLAFLFLIKWDMNRYAAEMGSRNRDKSQWKEMWVRNTQGVYRLIEELRRRHPHVEFEACASGGGRVD